MICCAPVRVTGCVAVVVVCVAVVLDVAAIIVSTAVAKSSIHKHLSCPFN